MNPKVSVLCITFNQARFIGQAIESFLKQETDFPFEVLIHDDASTDGTTEIVQEYARKYPKIIKLYLERENRYSKHDFEFIKDMYINAKGKYIAICEGDDYWTSLDKLQLQVEFLEKNKDYDVCFHPTKVIFEKNEVEDTVYPSHDETSQFTSKNLIKVNFIQTCSVMYRRREDYSDMFADAMPGDWYTHLYHAQTGKIGFINKIMSVYRRHQGGVWWGAHKKKDEFWVKFGMTHIQTYNEILKMYGSKKSFELVVYEAVSGIFEEILKMDDTKKSNLIISESSTKYPDMLRGAFESYRHRINDLGEYAKKQGKDINI